jgi:predicted nucleic acid-binding protein
VAVNQIERVYLYDTDTVTAIHMGTDSVTEKVSRIPRSRTLVSIVTVAEVMQGWLADVNRSQSSVKGNICLAYDNLSRAHENLKSFNIIRYDAQAEAVFESFPAAVRRTGTNDCRIAATAIAHGLIVVTRDMQDFARIPGVQFEDWTV